MSPTKSEAPTAATVEASDVNPPRKDRNHKVNSTITPKIAPALSYGELQILASPLASTNAGTCVHLSAQSPALTLGKTDGIARQQAIENALSLALWHIRQDVSLKHIHAATVKAVRAASMLKQACSESVIGWRA